MNDVSKRCPRLAPAVESLEGRALMSVGLHGRVAGSFAVTPGPLPGIEVVSYNLRGRAPRVGPAATAGSFYVPGTGIQSLLPRSQINGVPVLVTSNVGAVAGPANLTLQQLNRNFARLTVLGTVTTGTNAFAGATGNFHSTLRLDLRNGHVTGNVAGLLR